MLKGLPCRLTRADLVKVLNIYGFHGRYNFVYVAFDTKTHACRGFAFVCMRTHEDALRAFNKFKGFRDWGFSSDVPVVSEKVVLVTWAENQDLDERVSHYRNHPIMHKSVSKEHQPILFGEDGKEKEFPPPENGEVKRPPQGGCRRRSTRTLIRTT